VSSPATSLSAPYRSRSALPDGGADGEGRGGRADQPADTVTADPVGNAALKSLTVFATRRGRPALPRRADPPGVRLRDPDQIPRIPLR